MAEGLFTVEPDGSLMVEKHKEQPSVALDELLATFAEPVHTTASRSHYRLTAASIWRTRRSGLSLLDITHALETHCETDIPDSLMADVELWSQQIDRLKLEIDQGRLVLRSNNPLLIPAVQRQHALRRFIKQKIDTHTLELQADMESDLMQAFDGAQYPILDQRRAEPTASVPRQAPLDEPSPGQHRTANGGQKRQPAIEKPERTVPRPPARASRRTDDLFNVFRSSLSHQCQATTRMGRQCKNRVRPPGRYCRIHMEMAALRADDTETAFSQDTFYQLLDIDSSITVVQMALFRVGISVVIGLGTWLVHTLIMWIGAGGFDLPLASWYTIPIALILACWLVSLLVFAGSIKAILVLLVVSQLSILMDFFNKDGLILNICFVLIPFVVPLYLLYRYSLSSWWSLLFMPAGLFAGWMFYYILDESSE